MVNTGKSFESYVQFIYQVLLKAQGKNISVSRRATVYDNRGNPYNIDVFYQFDIAGVHHRVAIECKDTRRPVERDDALAFAGKIRDMPSTIGIFISQAGFQPAAKKYLEDHGIVHYSGGDLPKFGSVIGSMVAFVALPNESAVGQPFWSLMELAKGETTGSWVLIPDQSEEFSPRKKQQKLLFPLFYSRPQADLFRTLWFNEESSACVRGIEQATLRFIILCAHDEGRSFAILQPIDDGGRQIFSAETMTAQQLSAEYAMDDPLVSSS